MKNRALFRIDLQKLANQLAEKECMDVNDIYLTILPNFMQTKKEYKMGINLFLPSVNTDDRVKSMQHSLQCLLIIHFSLRPSEIFIMTSIIRSGNVLVNGTMVEWQRMHI